MSDTVLRHRLATFALMAFGCAGQPAADLPMAAAGSGGGAGGPPSAPVEVPTEMGAPGCGLEAAAFCETFEQPASAHGRAGELDPLRFSGGRLQPQLPTGSGQVFAIGPATVPSCRSGLPDRVLPDQDALVCDPSADIASHHLLVAVAAQNYGINSYRVRQPFDFEGRTGTIVFDAEGYTEQLLGWISLEVTLDPIAVPSYGVIDNDEGGILPKKGVELQFAYTCNTSPPSQVSLSAIHVFDDYADHVVPAAWKSTPPSACVSTAPGKLNHFEVRISEHRIEVYVSPVSADGTTFEPATLMLGADVTLGFSRGYVHFSTHNHATLKYSPGNELDAWLTRWDNVGFDGPVVRNFREYEVDDALVAAPGGRVNVGYRVADEASGPADVLRLTGVDLAGAVSARLALSAWYLRDAGGLDDFVLLYRFNGGTWRERKLGADEIQALTKPLIDGAPTGGSQGAIGQILDVPLEDLVPGDNTLEFVSRNVPQNYPPAVLNLDLVV
ncbi:MAG TPA: hypothetical protein VGQ57_20135, partial [Polyangiaceae bacterium]|nr:hypothetical protein [Polyangiaceae bacterium]